MDQQQQSRWHTRRQVTWIAIGVVAVLFPAIVVLGYYFAWKWTGYPKRTPWDWADLLIIPFVLALGGYLFALSENQRTQRIAEQQRTLARELAEQRRQDDMLQGYLDEMGQLLTDQNRPLHRARPGDRLSTVVRARTLTVLPKLDGGRKGILLRFLYEADLLNKNTPVFDIDGADLSKADLSGAALSDATLPPPLFSPNAPPLAPAPSQCLT